MGGQDGSFGRVPCVLFLPQLRRSRNHAESGIRLSISPLREMRLPTLVSRGRGGHRIAFGGKSTPAPHPCRVLRFRRLCAMCVLCAESLDLDLDEDRSLHSAHLVVAEERGPHGPTWYENAVRWWTTRSAFTGMMGCADALNRLLAVQSLAHSSNHVGVSRLVMAAVRSRSPPCAL